MARDSKGSPSRTRSAGNEHRIVPIPDLTNLHRLEEDPSAADIELSERDLVTIEQAASEIQIAGERYPAQLLASTGR